IISNDVEGNTDLLRRAKEVFRNFDCRVFDYSNPFEFINLISRVDSIVTPKLHVGIFGATYGKPIISFPLHPEKTLRYYSQIGYPEVSKSLFEVTESDIKIMIDRYLWRPVELSEEILQLADKNFRIFDQITF
ncbi:polysaccharide pyruvyl transferase family protein, partial [Candidatus Enterococcus testudinis]|uniref:polysaccharide pyruvyl transferase family protein n=1 Tax=Candidatus Enterococcus testudinis TaxID=1834191 RepID=UPI0015C51CF8